MDWGCGENGVRRVCGFFLDLDGKRKLISIRATRCRAGQGKHVYISEICRSIRLIR